MNTDIIIKFQNEISKLKKEESSLKSSIKLKKSQLEELKFYNMNKLISTSVKSKKEINSKFMLEKQDYQYNNNNYIILSNEIKLYCLKKSNIDLLNNTFNIVNIIKEKIKSIDNSYEIEIIGSYSNNTYIKESNIDILLFNQSDINNNYKQISETLLEEINLDKNFEVLQYNDKLSFQILLVIKYNNDFIKNRQITIFIPQQKKFIKENNKILNKYIIEDTSIRFCLIVVKKIFYKAELISKNKNGISTDLLFFMFLSYFQFKKVQQKYHNDLLGFHLTDFFLFYIKFDYANKYLSPNPISKIKDLENPIKDKKDGNILHKNFEIIDSNNPIYRLINNNNKDNLVFSQIRDILNLCYTNFFISEKYFLNNLIKVGETYKYITNYSIK